MAAYIYTVKDWKTDEVLFRGYQQECGNFLGCDTKYVWVLSEKDTQKTPWSKYGKFKIEREWGEDVANAHGGRRSKNVICADCGTLMEGASAKRRRCPQCAEKWAKEYNRRQMRERRNLQQEVYSIVDVDKDQAEMQRPCIGCAYFTGMSAYARTCNYIFVEDHSRGCPPGKNCTKRKERKISD